MQPGRAHWLHFSMPTIPVNGLPALSTLLDFSITSNMSVKHQRPQRPENFPGLRLEVPGEREGRWRGRPVEKRFGLQG